MRRIWALVLAAALMSTLTACGEKESSSQVFAMDTVMLLSARGGDCEEAVSQAEETIRRMEELLSRTREDSEVSRINGADGGETAVDPAVGQLLAAAGPYQALTGGAFDITIAPVSDAWGFTRETQQVPAPEVLAEALERVDGTAVRAEERDGQWYAAIAPRQEIDLGGIAKGYLGDLVAGIYESRGVTSGMVSLGGNIYARGVKEDGSSWRVGIQDPKAPQDPNALAVVLLLEDAFAVTSGGYQRNFTENGTVYHHIIDPATGYPADSGLTSVTVVADAAGRTEEPGSGAMCDALSTALFVMGEEKAMDLWRQAEGLFELALVTADGRVVLTGGLADRFVEMEESGYRYETVS